jgi:hypothetical protein
MISLNSLLDQPLKILHPYSPGFLCVEPGEDYANLLTLHLLLSVSTDCLNFETAEHFYRV